jgi:hypothetical protein
MGARSNRRLGRSQRHARVDWGAMPEWRMSAGGHVTPLVDERRQQVQTVAFISVRCNDRVMAVFEPNDIVVTNR